MSTIKRYFSVFIHKVLGTGNQLAPHGMKELWEQDTPSRLASAFAGGERLPRLPWGRSLDGVLSQLIVEVQWGHHLEESLGDSHWWLESEPALGLIEFTSIPMGIKYCDQMLKQSPIHLLEATTICPGRFVTMIGGDAVTVDYAMQKGLSADGDWIADHLYLPNVDPKVVAALAGRPVAGDYDSLGVIETSTVAAGIIAADTAVKMAEVFLLRIRLARELGGKAYLILAGSLGEVEASLDHVKEVMAGSGHLLQSVTVPVPDEALIRRMGLFRRGEAVSEGGLKVYGK